MTNPFNKITCWIQSADFSSRDEGTVSKDDAIKLFLNHNWKDELSKKTEIDNKKDESCDPGIGFIADIGILHICPDNKDASVHFHFEKKVLRIFSKTENHFNACLDKNTCIKAIEHLFNSEPENIIAILDK